MMTREQRLKERETNRILNEEKLRKAKEDMEKLENNEARMSERHLRQEMKRREEELQKLSAEDHWIFDCEKCGKHGDNYVRLPLSQSRAVLTCVRMMAHIAWRAKSVIYGSTASVMALPKLRLSEKISISSALRASKRRKPQTSPNYPR
jgi:hypothetical protein